MSLFNEQSNITKVNSYLQPKTNCRTGHKIQYAYSFLCIHPFSMTMYLSGKAQQASDPDTAVQAHTHTPTHTHAHTQAIHLLAHTYPPINKQWTRFELVICFGKYLVLTHAFGELYRFSLRRMYQKSKFLIEGLIKIQSLPGQRLSLQLKRQLRFLIY